MRVALPTFLNDALCQAGAFLPVIRSRTIRTKASMPPTSFGGFSNRRASGRQDRVWTGCRLHATRDREEQDGKRQQYHAGDQTPVSLRMTDISPYLPMRWARPVTT